MKVQAGTGFLVGSIQESLLSEAQFQEAYGDDWALMDGRDVTGSVYADITGNNTLPDARGQFLRCLDESGTIDPDGAGRSLGDAQVEKTKLPENPFGMTTGNESAGHTHSRWFTYGFHWTGFNNPGYGNPGSSPTAGSWTTAGNNSSHTHSANSWSGGDNETVPKNVCVNIFVKIN